ncbi:hypothetical protein ACFQS5_11370 [Salinirubellus sp. GCM10025899]|jgi:hypothetical protein|uniref:hypothetical protein n=1 Tax=Salinirubellus sp. GCM10025899 TaxID=3252689 RepID=UPI003617EAE2
MFADRFESHSCQNSTRGHPSVEVGDGVGDPREVDGVGEVAEFARGVGVGVGDAVGIVAVGACVPVDPAGVAVGDVVGPGVDAIPGDPVALAATVSDPGAGVGVPTEASGPAPDMRLTLKKRTASATMRSTRS